MIATLPGFRSRITARRASAVDGLVVDNFAGAGGASLGIEAAIGRAVDVAINHDRRAIETHERNHPATKHLHSDVWEVDPVATCAGRPVALAWFSPDCKHFSKAKGGKPASKRVRGLAWVVIRWAKAVRPSVIILENVEEFQMWGPLGADSMPCVARRGQTFRRWRSQLERLGYVVEHRELRACDFGVPTTRKRFFLVARCDGLPIVWPAPTHADPKKADAVGLKPWRTAAECIDWDIACPSIFERRRPLAEATQRRIANGLRRYVLEAKQPFIVRMGHYSNVTGEGSTFRGQPLTRPLATVCAHGNDKGLVVPFVATLNHSGEGFRGHGLDQPMRTLTASRDAHALVAPFVVGAGGPVYAGKPSPADQPIGTLTVEDHRALVTAFLAKHYGGMVGHSFDRPLGTVTAKDHHALVTSNLELMYGTGRGRSVEEPMPTVTSQGNHIAEVRAFLVAYFGNDRDGQTCTAPLRTLTSKQRFGLVEIDGYDFQVIDIGMRMLVPRELLRAQFGRFADAYVLSGTQAQQIAGIGNSVCPELAEALVRANVRTAARRVAKKPTKETSHA